MQQFCTSVAWQPPLQPNGVIVGYEVRFSSSFNPSEIVRLGADANSLITDHQQRRQGVLVEVKKSLSACERFAPYQNITTMITSSTWTRSLDSPCCTSQDIVQEILAMQFVYTHESFINTLYYAFAYFLLNPGHVQTTLGPPFLVTIVLCTCR